MRLSWVLVVAVHACSASPNCPRKKARVRFLENQQNDVGAVMGDVGSYSCKMGFAGEDFPRAYFT
ncbi:hypothetical protein Esi_0196_0025 [Ectocarpus siliculosus]|uniref:Uncharacterized protein n=1 Tax=Ectocarpus siliculosus TaxID=2880 RepID=D8LHI9_ECTSI|nr:hypothetical protein Esi_0196_0025 [Ectocarpus siliculosus]|eukprot:CBN79271.1 hypothetical protein Esi_0196_0025 [Ectocarpus siliculosus]